MKYLNLPLTLSLVALLIVVLSTDIIGQIQFISSDGAKSIIVVVTAIITILLSIRLFYLGIQILSKK